MSERDITTLNALIATTIDSADGYEQTAAVVGDVDLAGLFRRFGAERRSVVDDLRAHVVRLGGKPEADGTLLASAHRLFVSLKTRLAADDRKAAVVEIERGEDHLRAKYEQALTGDLTPDVRAAVERAYQSVRSGSDLARDLKAETS